MLRQLPILTVRCALAVVAGSLHGAERSLSNFARVEVAATKTSIYLGSVAMTMPAFTRANGSFESTYDAKVFPYFFYNESGKMSVDISDEALRKLERGEPIEFKVRAVRGDGAELRV